MKNKREQSPEMFACLLPDWLIGSKEVTLIPTQRTEELLFTANA